MVALNFNPAFAHDIRSGHKTQTIRQNTRVKTGDTLQIRAATKNGELIGTATCAICEPVTINEDFVCVGYGGWWLSASDAEHIAKIDGFASLAAMRDWFRDRYGLPFHGYRIMWNDFRSAGE